MILFSKMQGTGNDFVVINCLNQYFNYHLGSLANFLCNRNFGIGADGVIYLFQSSSADFKMRIFNKDGSEAEMCGNGIRVLGKFLYEKSITTKTEIRIETLAGIKTIELMVENKTVVNVRVNMGIPYFEASRIPAYLPREEMAKTYHTISIEVEKENYDFDLVSMGNPHAVCFVEDLAKINIEKIGAFVETYKYFPSKTNVEFVQVVDRNNLKVKVWERGVGKTISCGTGACAASVCAMKRNLVNSNVTVQLDGGRLHIKNDEKNGIEMTGGAEFCFEGRIDL
ncbi:MAG: diaminopimelate epimerase [Clostridia bacterium]|nr:diaminopimelate epimerase [Clostridia bacterium]